MLKKIETFTFALFSLWCLASATIIHFNNKGWQEMIYDVRALEYVTDPLSFWMFLAFGILSAIMAFARHHSSEEV